MTAKQRDREISYWNMVIRKYANKPFRTDLEKQQVWYAESRIQDIREEWRKSKLQK